MVVGTWESTSSFECQLSKAGSKEVQDYHD
jgi:hypothetical protein